MAYGRRSRTTYGRRTRSSGGYTRRRATGRRTTARPRRAGASRTARGGREVRIVIEQSPVSTVARPSYLASLNPAVVTAARAKKAKY